MKKISTLFVLMFLVINLLGQNAKEPELLKFLAPVFQSRGADKSLSGASVLYFTDGTLGTDQMLVSLESYGSSITLSVVTTSAAFADSIITHSYDIAILLVQNYQASNYTDGINALINFINEGGIGMYSDWSLNSTFATQLGFSFTGNTNNTIVTVLPPMSDDLDENPIILTNPGWGVFSTGLATTDGIVHATFSNGDAAILETMDGHAFIYGFTNDATALPDIFTTGNEYASGGLYPSDITLCSLDESGQFEAVMDSAETFQWSISIDGGSTYEELSDDETYTGSATSVLTINQITEDMLDYLYVCVGYWGEGQSDTSRIAGILFETESPEWALEDVYTLYTCESDTVVLTLPLPTDNCGIDSIYHDSEFGVSPTDPSGEYPLGTTTVNYYVEDVNGNSIAGSFVVEVLPDNVPPSWGIEGDVFASYTSTTAGGTTWSVVSGGVLSGHPYSGGTCCSGYDPPFDVMTFTPATTGTYTITSTYSGFDGYLLLYTDPHSLAVNPPVTFVAGDDDYTSTSNAQITPTLNAGQNYYMYNTGYGTGSGSFTTNFSPAVMQANVIYGEACADSLWVDFSQPGDNCGLDSIAHDSPYGISDTDPSGYYPTGVTVVNYYLRDIYGNISEGIFSVNVVTDETSPVWAVGDTVLYTCADSAELTLPLPEDECGIDSIWHDSPYGISGTDPGGWYPMGTTTVNLYVEDNHGNIYTGSINVTVETEVEAPAWDIKDTTITACGETGNLKITAASIRYGMIHPLEALTIPAETIL